MTKRQSEQSSQNRIQAVQNAFEIINELQAGDGCNLSYFMDRLELPRSTAHVYLKTLEELGYIKKHGENYYLGIRFLEQGGYARHQSDIYQIARSEVDELAKKTQSVATIGCEDDGLRVLLYRTEPTNAVSDNAPTGEYTQMHWTALGKALLSNKSTEEIESIAGKYGLPGATENTLTSVDSLIDDIEDCRDRGYAIEDEERVEGIRSIAAPVEIEDGMFDNVAISIAGPKPKFNFDRIEDELSSALQETVNVIDLKQQHY